MISYAEELEILIAKNKEAGVTEEDSTTPDSLRVEELYDSITLIENDNENLDEQLG